MADVSRRWFLGGLGEVLAAPAIVRYSSLMPVRVPPLVVVPAAAMPVGPFRHMGELEGVWDLMAQVSGDPFFHGRLTEQQLKRLEASFDA